MTKERHCNYFGGDLLAKKISVIIIGHKYQKCLYKKYLQQHLKIVVHAAITVLRITLGLGTA